MADSRKLFAISHLQLLYALYAIAIRHLLYAIRHLLFAIRQTMPPNVPIVTPDFLFSSSVKRGNKSKEFDLALSNASTDSKAEEFKLAASRDETPPPPGLPQLETGEVEDALASALAALLIAPIPMIMPIAEGAPAATPVTPEASSTIGKTESLVPTPQTLTASTTTNVNQALPLAESATSNINFKLQTSNFKLPNHPSTLLRQA